MSFSPADLLSLAPPPTIYVSYSSMFSIQNYSRMNHIEFKPFQVHINTNSCHYSSNTEAAEECQSKHLGNLQGTEIIACKLLLTILILFT